MNPPKRSINLAATALLLAGSAAAQSNIDPDKAFAWGENIGWINLLADGTNGVVVTESHLSGFAWGENVGWIWFGSGPQDGAVYTQDTGDTGVNNDGTGNLSGFAWGENIGWINFDTTSADGSQVTVNMATGEFSGFAWSESTGWINFGHDYGVSFLPETSVSHWMLLE